MDMDDELNSNNPIEKDSEEDRTVEDPLVLDDQDSNLEPAEFSLESPIQGEEHDALIADVDASSMDDGMRGVETDDHSTEQTDAEVPLDISDTQPEADADPMDISYADQASRPPAEIPDESYGEEQEEVIQESAEAYDLPEEERISESEAKEDEMIVDAPEAEATDDEIITDAPDVEIETDEVSLVDSSVDADTANASDEEVATIPDVVSGEEVLSPDDVQEDDGRAWYVVHCYSGYENKVRHNLEQRIETMGMKDEIFDVVVPTEEEIEVKDGTRRTVERRVFPGYILVNLILTEESWYVVRNTPGVTSFVGMGNEPIPLRPEEVSQIVKRMEAEAPRIKVTFKSGERVRIIDGPFNEFRGTVAEIDMERAKVRVMVNFFGRETPVELDFLQVEKA